MLCKGSGVRRGFLNTHAPGGSVVTNNTEGPICDRGETPLVLPFPLSLPASVNRCMNLVWDRSPLANVVLFRREGSILELLAAFKELHELAIDSGRLWQVAAFSCRVGNRLVHLHRG